MKMPWNWFGCKYLTIIWLYPGIMKSSQYVLKSSHYVLLRDHVIILTYLVIITLYPTIILLYLWIILMYPVIISCCIRGSCDHLNVSCGDIFNPLAISCDQLTVLCDLWIMKCKLQGGCGMCLYQGTISSSSSSFPNASHLATRGLNKRSALFLPIYETRWYSCVVQVFVGVL